MTEMNWYATQRLLSERNQEIERQARHATDLQAARAARRSRRRCAPTGH